MNVGFVGTGRMGAPMARSLAAAGHAVSVYNRTRARADALADVVSVVDTLAEVVSDREIVVTMLADDAAVEEVAFGTPAASKTMTPGIVAGLPSGAIHVSMSTISAALSKRLLEAHAAAGQGFVAAPVFGRPEAAAAKKLWVVAGGADELVARCRPLFDAVGSGLTVVGQEPWQANVVKLCGNFSIAAMLETLGEAYAVVRKSGVEAGVFLDVVNSALFKSPLYQNYGTLVAEGRFEPPGFMLKLGLKDVRLALQAADAAEVPMPLASLLHDHLLSAVALGKGDLDWAALGALPAERAGLAPR